LYTLPSQNNKRKTKELGKVAYGTPGPKEKRNYLIHYKSCNHQGGYLDLSRQPGGILTFIIRDRWLKTDL